MLAIERQRRSGPSLIATVVLGLLAAGSAPPTRAEKEIAAFNQRFVDIGRRVDTAALKAVVAEDGVNLLPGMTPMVGKKVIARWLDLLGAQVTGYRVVTNEIDFRDLQVCGAWATEWGPTHQVVQPPGNGPPIVTYGTMLLVLHRQASGEWQIEREMWVPAPPPALH